MIKIANIKPCPIVSAIGYRVLDKNYFKENF